MIFVVFLCCWSVVETYRYLEDRDLIIHAHAWYSVAYPEYGI